MDDLVQVYRVVIHPELIPDGDIGPLLEALSDFGPALELMGGAMAEAQQENFATAGGYFGDPWPDLSPKTEWQKHRLGYPPQPLVREGRLQEAIGRTVLIDGSSVTAGIDLADVPYARFHQEGRGRLPQRILVALTPQQVDVMLTILRDFVAERAGVDAAAVEVITL